VIWGLFGVIVGVFLDDCYSKLARSLIFQTSNTHYSSIKTGF